MELNQRQKDNLKALLVENSSDEERTFYHALEVSKFNSQVDGLGATVKKVKNDLAALAEIYKDAAKEIVKSILDLRGALSGVAKDLNPNAAPVYKDMINAISSVKKSVDDKPTPNWRWPQYAGVSVRNKNFANINPAISSFGIEDYDDITLSYTGSNLTGVTYKLNGAVTAVLALTYTGSNLTHVARTS